MARAALACFYVLSLVLSQFAFETAWAKVPKFNEAPAETTIDEDRPSPVEEPDIPAESPSAPPLNEPVIVRSPPARLRSADIRARNEFTASYTGAILGLAVPFKHGPALGWIVDKDWTIEASYFTGNLSFGTGFLSVGSFSENLIAVQARYYPRNTFNWIIGFSRQSYNAKLGSEFITRLSGGNIPGDVDVLKVATIGLQVGLGNRWQWENGISLGVDWVVLNFPFQTLKTDAPFLQYVSDPNDRRTVEDFIRVMKFFPTGAISKVSLGYTF